MRRTEADDAYDEVPVVECSWPVETTGRRQDAGDATTTMTPGSSGFHLTPSRLET